MELEGIANKRVSEPARGEASHSSTAAAENGRKVDSSAQMGGEERAGVQLWWAWLCGAGHTNPQPSAFFKGKVDAALSLILILSWLLC